MPGDGSEAEWRFPTTGRIWPLVEQARRGQADSRQALGQLLMKYLPPLRSHLVRHKRIAPDRAEDLLQGFIASRVCEQHLIEQADLARGRFRTFLLAALDHYVIGVLRHDKAKKRGGAAAMQAVDEHLDVSSSAREPAEEYDIAWARQVLDQTLRLMQDECEKSRRPDIWGVFEFRILRPMLQREEPIEYDELVKRFALESPAQAGNVLITAKRMFKRLLEAVVGEYARDRAEVADEIRDLTMILSRART